MMTSENKNKIYADIVSPRLRVVDDFESLNQELYDIIDKTANKNALLQGASGIIGLGVNLMADTFVLYRYYLPMIKKIRAALGIDADAKQGPFIKALIKDIMTDLLVDKALGSVPLVGIVANASCALAMTWRLGTLIALISLVDRKMGEQELVDAYNFINQRYFNDEPRHEYCTDFDYFDNFMYVIEHRIVRENYTFHEAVLGKKKALENSTTEALAIDDSVQSTVKNNYGAVSLLNRFNTITNLLYGHDFEGFVHYTAYQNLEKIFSSGMLKSREDLEKEGEVFKDSAKQSIISKTDKGVKSKARLLYYYNAPITYRFERDHPKEDFVVLVFDGDIVNSVSLTFYEKGAAVVGARHTTRADVAAKKFDYSRIFERGPHAPGDRESVQYRDAEVLCNDGFIDLKYLKAVYFKTRRVYKKAKEEFAGTDYVKLFKLDKEKRRFI